VEALDGDVVCVVDDHRVLVGPLGQALAVEDDAVGALGIADQLQAVVALADDVDALAVGALLDLDRVLPGGASIAFWMRL